MSPMTAVNCSYATNVTIYNCRISAPAVCDRA
jgi:hypothetical protein